MFEHDRSAARGLMSARRLIVYEHISKLGNAPAHELFDRIEVLRVVNGEVIPAAEARKRNAPAARSFADYRVNLDGEEVTELFKLIPVGVG